MSFGPSRYFTATMTSAGTLTSEVDLGRVWDTVYLEIPTMTSNTQLHIQASRTLGGSYRRVFHPSINSSTVGTNVFAVPSNVTNAIIPIPNDFQYVKVESTATVNDGALFRIICGSP